MKQLPAPEPSDSQVCYVLRRERMVLTEARYVYLAGSKVSTGNNIPSIVFDAKLSPCYTESVNCTPATISSLDQGKL